MKKLFTFFLALVAGAGTLFAASVEVDGIWYTFNSSKKTATVTYEGSSYSTNPDRYTGDVVIPDTVLYNDVKYCVIAIGSSAFKGCKKLTSVAMGNSVTSIGGSSFYNCTALTSINIPNGVTYIGSDAFYGCAGLTSMDIPNGVKSIEMNTFYECTGLTSVTLGDSVTSIGQCAFYKCKNLTSINLPNTITSIAYGAFWACSSLASITIPDGITTIETKAFSGCAMTSITIPDGVTNIESDAFRGCSKLTSINIPDGVTQMGTYAFSGCSSLTSVKIGTGIISIENYTFANCSGLTSVKIGNNVTSIGNYAFQKCTSLSAITIPVSITKIGDHAFQECSGLKTVICKPTTPPEYGNNCFHIYCCGASILIPISTLKVPAESVELYKNAEGWKEAFTEILPITETNNIYVTVPTDVPEGYYENMTIELHNLSRDTVERNKVFNKRKFLFDDLVPGNKYQAFLINAYRQVMGQTEAMELGEDELELTIDKLLQKKDVTMKVTIPDGTDVTDKVSVLWTDETDKALGYASLLKAVAEGTKLICKVTPRNELAGQYAAPDTVHITVNGEGENLLAMPLRPIQITALHGMVKDKQTGEIIADATVALTQQLGDSYLSVTTTTDSNGLYELQGTNGRGDLLVTAPGYLHKTVEYNAPASDGALPVVELELFNGVMVNAWFTYTEAAPAGTEGQSTDGYDYGDVAWQVFNKTTDAAVKNFTIKNNALYFSSDVAIGDELTVTVSSHSNNFSLVSASCEIEKSGLGYVTLPLVQNGCLEATVSSAASNSVMGMLYDANGHFVRSDTYRFGKLSFAKLAAGDYTLISMTSNILLSRVLLLSTFSDMGLVEGTDYVKNAVHIEDGRITSVNVANVPEFIGNSFFKNTRTYFIVKKSTANVGEYIPCASRVNFAEQYVEHIDIHNVELVVDVPEEITMSGSYRHEDGHYIFRVNNLSNYGWDDIYFFLKSTKTGKFQVSTSVRFKLDGVKMLLPIGSAFVNFKGFTMDTPMFTSNTTLYVSGTAPLDNMSRNVEIYDYDKLVGIAKVDAAGKWMTDVQYPDNGTTLLHAIKARLITPETGDTESEVKYVLHSDNAKIAKKVVMIDQKKEKHQFNYFAANSNMYYGYVLEKTWSVYGWEIYYGPFNTEFTFLAYFDNVDISDEDNVKIAVLASDGTTRTLNAAYDSQNKCYYATTNYTHYTKIPVSTYAFVEKTPAPFSEEELAALADAQEKAVAKATQAAVKAAKTKGEIEILPDDGETLNFKYTVSGKEPYAFSMKEMSYDEAAAYVMENGPLFYRGEAGNIAFTFVDGTDEAVMILIDMDERYALRTVITYADNLSANSRKKFVGTRKFIFGDLLNGAGKLGSGVLSVLGLMDYFNAPEQLSEIDAMRERLHDAMQKECDEIDNAMNGNCVDGSFGDPGFSPDQMDDYANRYNDLINKGNELLHQMEDAYNSYLMDLGRKILWDAGTTALGVGMGKAIAAGAATRLVPKAETFIETIGATIGAGGVSQLGFVKDLIKSGKLGNPSLDQLLSIDFKRHYEDYKKSLDRLAKDLMDDLNDLHQDMVDNQEDCENECEDEDDEDCKKEPKDDDDDDDDNKKIRRRNKRTRPPYRFPKSATPHIDPSGYIYEAVPSNRVEGATAVLYYKDNMLNEEGNSTGETDVMWDAENYGQINPQITGADGMYQWDVPQGLWQVRVSKDGYENNNSDWLPVPPPQLDVNIPLVRNRLPKVESAHAYENAVAVRFDSYMLPEYLNTEQITVTENGADVAGTIELTDEEAAPDSAKYASKLRFVPSKAFTAKEVTLRVSGQVQSYSGIEMDEPYEVTLPIERELKKLVADAKVKVEYQNTGVIHVQGEPAAAAAGKTVTIQCASGIITSTTQTSVVLNENGEADVTVNGDLPGTDYVRFTFEETELTASTTVKVVLELDFHVDVPEASVASETEVEKGTQVTLSCKTEGAKIYYTLDGSSPLDSDTRILYDAPVVINEETTLTAVAVIEDKGVSEVAVFHYTVKVDDAIADVNGNGIHITPVHVHDAFMVTGMDGNFNVNVYSVTGKLLIRQEQVRSGEKVNAALPTGVYLVVASNSDTSFAQRIIKE